MATRGGRKRDRAKERLWRRTIRRQQGSGLPIREFCRREGLKDCTFRWWRKELARRERRAGSPPRIDPAVAPAVATPVFLPVRVVESGTGAARPPAPIEIVLPEGPTVRVPEGFDPRTLRAVLTVLEGGPC
jgi:hypothetical protein